jgi:hypothetical protein
MREENRLFLEAGTNHHLPQECRPFPGNWQRQSGKKHSSRVGEKKWLRYYIFCILSRKASLCRWSWCK